MNATVYISTKAFFKMQGLIHHFNKEVGWYGTVTKLAPGKYRVEDILVFPQYTNDTQIDDEDEDPLEHTKWLASLSEETFLKRRLWGHSHVNMGVTPSCEDNRMFERQVDLFSRAKTNPFILCLITNKKGKEFWYIYDKEDKAEYTKVTSLIELEPGVVYDDWLNEVTPLVKEKKIY